MNKNILYLCMGVVATGLFAGCASAPKPDPMAFANQALAATDSAKIRYPKGSPAEIETIARFRQFNGDFSVANITNNTKGIYAPDIWFRDPFKEIHGEADFEAYLLKDADAVAQFSMEWQDVAVNDGDYYFRWVMHLKFKSDGKDKPPGQNPGISHVRFGPDGKVIFQQDYYDAGAFLYEKIPILGSEIRFIKKRL